MLFNKQPLLYACFLTNTLWLRLLDERGDTLLDVYTQAYFHDAIVTNSFHTPVNLSGILSMSFKVKCLQPVVNSIKPTDEVFRKCEANPRLKDRPLSERLY